MEVVPEAAIRTIKKAKRNWVTQDIVIISRLNIRRLFLPQAVHTAQGKNKGTLMTLLHVLHSLTSIRSAEEPEATSLLLHQMPCLQPPTTQHLLQVPLKPAPNTPESWVFTTWCKWEFSFSWFVNTAATHKSIFFILRWSLTLPCPTNIYNLFGTWCFKNKNSFVIMVWLCI